MTDQFLHGVEVEDIPGGIRPISTVPASVIGIVGTAPRADVVAFPLNTPVLIANSRTLAAKLLTNAGADDGSLPDALDSIFDQAGATVVVVRVDAGLTEAETLANIVGGVNAINGRFEGVHALLAAESILGVKPKILVATGWTHQRPADPVKVGQSIANPVVAELIGIADRLRSVTIADGPSTNDAAAITYAGDFGSKRVFVIDPRVIKIDALGAPYAAPASACVAGLIVRSDNERGWWWSPSNQTINGIVGIERAVDFSLGDPSSRSNLLNAASVATIIRKDGFRLWGNRTLSDDPKWAFLSMVRIADIVSETLQEAHLWAVAQNITKNYVQEVRDGVKARIRAWVAIGALLGGDAWVDPEINTPENIAAGKIAWDFDFTGPTPAEHLTFRAHMVNSYITEVI